MKCKNCGEEIEIVGFNYRGENRWIHKKSCSIQCLFFATPNEESDESET